MPNKIRNITYFSKGERGRRCFEAVWHAGYSVLAVVCDEITSVDSDFFRRFNLKPILFSEDLPSNSPHPIHGDLFVLAGFTRILEKPFLEMPKLASSHSHRVLDLLASQCYRGLHAQSACYSCALGYGSPTSKRCFHHLSLFIPLGASVQLSCSGGRIADMARIMRLRR